ncbi:hypothetical protein L9F63_012300, partial [Diploptera punctata]
FWWSCVQVIVFFIYQTIVFSVICILDSPHCKIPSLLKTNAFSFAFVVFIYVPFIKPMTNCKT